MAATASGTASQPLSPVHTYLSAERIANQQTRGAADPPAIDTAHRHGHYSKQRRGYRGVEHSFVFRLYKNNKVS